MKGTSDPIDEFQGEYRWLSNFWPAKVVYEGQTYPSVEHAYQAAKTLNAATRRAIQLAPSPQEAKRIGKQATLRDGWSSMRIGVMRQLLAEKFADPALRKKLIETYPRQLIEGNQWGDRFWGVDLHTRVGDNHLGKLLMRLRDDLLSTRYSVVGFTGTQQGGTPAQVMSLRRLLRKLEVAELHHGDCVGADAQANHTALQLGIRVYLHPPSDASKRAWCVGPHVRVYDPLPYHERNRAIVRAAQALIVMPFSAEEQLRSGTWSTYRYAKKRGVPRYLIYPNGNIRKEDD